MGIRDFPKDHTYGRRPTRVMSTGWDGNLGLNATGGVNVRSASEMKFGEDQDGNNEIMFGGDEDDREMALPPWQRSATRD